MPHRNHVRCADRSSRWGRVRVSSDNIVVGVRRRRSVVSMMAAIAVVAAAVAIPAVGAGAAKQASGPSGSITTSYDFGFQGGFSFDPQNSVTGLNPYLQH